MRRVLALMLVGALGCGGSQTDGPTLPITDANVAGTFALVSANGNLLPVLAYSTVAGDYHLVADSITLTDANTWSDKTSYVVVKSVTGATTTADVVSSGTWAITDRRIGLTTTSGGTAVFTGSVTGNTLTILFDGGTFIYTR